MHNSPRALRVVLLLSALLSLPASQAQAQLSVDRSEIIVRPTNALERVGVITITNTADRPVQAAIRLEDWDRSEIGANRWFRAGAVPGSCASMLTVFPASMTLDPGASQSVRLVVHDSAARSTRECWSAVMVETLQAANQRSGVAYLIRSAVKVYVQPTGLLSNGEVTDMSVLAADTPRGNASTSVDSVEVWFRNSGEVHYIAKGAVEFRRADNSVAARVPLEDYYLLPGARQRVRAAMPALPPGDYVAIAMVDFGGSEIAAMQMDYTAPARAIVSRER